MTDWLDTQPRQLVLYWDIRQLKRHKFLHLAAVKWERHGGMSVEKESFVGSLKCLSIQYSQSAPTSTWSQRYYKLQRARETKKTLYRLCKNQRPCRAKWLAWTDSLNDLRKMSTCNLFSIDTENLTPIVSSKLNSRAVQACVVFIELIRTSSAYVSAMVYPQGSHKTNESGI